ncbi:MAG TPA: hypothetical protein VF669_07470 [Tepidisphaeraceae bacterium]
MPRVRGLEFDPTLPNEAASELLSLPQGRRVLYNDGFDRFHDDNDHAYWVFNSPDDAYGGKWGLWVENGVAEMQEKWDSWFADFSSLSPDPGDIDMLVSDDEWNHLFLIDSNTTALQYDTPPNDVPYWADQKSNPKWYTYLFFGKTMAQWLELAGDPNTSFTNGHVNDWASRDHHLGNPVVLEQCAAGSGGR